MVSPRLEHLKEGIRAIELLRLYKKSHTYEELSSITGISVPALNRYVKGRVIPSPDTASELIQKVGDYIDLKGEVRRRISFNKYGYFDNTTILFDTSLLQMIADHVIAQLGDVKVDKVLTTATDGIPVAFPFAERMGASLVYAKATREVGVKDFLEEMYSPSSTGVLVTLYLPKNAIKKGEWVLVVDDVVRSGETQNAMANLVRKAGAKLTGIFVLTSVGGGAASLSDRFKCPVKAFVELEDPLKV